MSFVAAVEHLHALGQELAAPTTPRRKFDLEHMRILARALGDPQQQFPSVLIAGTNGKGSTGATLAAILSAAGYRTGLYTSPHLTRVTERIRISTPVSISPGRHSGAQLQNLSIGFSQPATDNLQPATFSEIPEESFARLYFRVDEAANQLVSAGQLPHHPSFFETLTALAFLYFAEQRLDIAILEVGMGGRLDATNIVEPILSIITDIALDHQEYLGSTIAAIACEKAGILRPNGTFITLPQHPDANHAIGEAAIALNVHAISATDYLPGRNFAPPTSPSESKVVILSGARSAQSKDLRLLPANHYDLTLSGETIHVRSPLAGEHQQRNIALAIAAAIELRNYFGSKSPGALKSRNQTSNKLSPDNLEPRTSSLEPEFNLEPRTPNLEPSITNSAIEAGIAATSWPGRLEFLPPNLLLDVAHNPAGAWTLRAAIATLPEDLPRTLIFSCLRDKDLTEMSQILFPLFDSTSTLEPRTSNLILTPIHNPRAASLEDLLTAARKLDIPAHPAEDPKEALALARSLTPANGLILATGSIYLIGALREQVLTP
jgi:dihydrofolate synthase/folylpolyglutamate synthase